MSTQAQNRYKADLREMRFLLFEQFKLGELLGQEPFENWGADEVNMTLDTAYKFVCDVLGPLSASGDRQGCRLEKGEVFAPDGFKAAWDAIYEAQFKTIATDPAHGGQGAPHMLQVLTEELITGANTAFSMYPGLAYGAAEVIAAFGTPAQKDKYMHAMMFGQAGGTMCLTEPHAGSDVGSSRTTAKRLGDGKYLITGTKIFISGGDHDLAPNVVHLVLARVEGAPAGTKGLSLFIVPKFLVNDDGSLGERNDVNVGNIEHKMGINGNATCVLNFGENEKCIGELVGTTENMGMGQMFHLMNGARISVGVQGVGVASFAFLNALDYAKDRKQGAPMTSWKDPNVPRVPIIEHADVRRMLLEMKSKVEGIRALIMKLANHQDQVRLFKGKDDEKTAYHQGQIDLLVPLVKAYGSDQAFRVCELAIQTYGGAGYTRDYPVEQAARDVKVFSIYEGTNHIQAMDLVGRKLGQHGGRNLQQFLGDLNTFISANDKHPVLGPAIKELSGAQEALGGMAMRLLMWFQTGRIALVPLAANRFLDMMSETAVAWMLLEGARIAVDKLAALPLDESSSKEHAFYEGKKHAALFYAKNILPNVKKSAEVLANEDTSPIDMPTEAFASV